MSSSSSSDEDIDWEDGDEGEDDFTLPAPFSLSDGNGNGNGNGNVNVNGGARTGSISVKLSEPPPPPSLSTSSSVKKKRRQSVTAKTFARRYPELLPTALTVHRSFVAAAVSVAVYNSKISSDTLEFGKVLSTLPSDYDWGGDGIGDLKTALDLFYRRADRNKKRKRAHREEGGQPMLSAARNLCVFLRALNFRVRLTVNIAPTRKDDVRQFIDGMLVRRVLGGVFSCERNVVKILSKSKKKKKKSENKKGREIAEKNVDVSEGIEIDHSHFEGDSVGDEALGNDAPLLAWVEVFIDERKKTPTGNDGKLKRSWITIDPFNQTYGSPMSIEKLLKKSDAASSFPDRLPKDMRGTVAYVVAVEHRAVEDGGTEEEEAELIVTDVTKRYASSWSKSSLLRDEHFFKGCLTAGKQFCGKKTMGGSSSSMPISLLSDDDDDHDGEATKQENSSGGEEEELLQRREEMPTSKAGFKAHPFFVLRSFLLSTEVLHPDAVKHVKGIFKGEPVFLRKFVSVAMPAKKWLYNSRKVKETELSRAVKVAKKRKAPLAKETGGGGNFQALDSYVSSGKGYDQQREIALGEAEAERIKTGAEEAVETIDLFGRWQTEPWSPEFVGENDRIPTNEFGNVELRLLNPGLVHRSEPRMAAVAKKLGIEYAPCLVGFDVAEGRSIPQIVGIVVKERDSKLMSDAYEETLAINFEKEVSKREARILNNWKRIVAKIFIVDELDKDFGRTEDGKK